MGRKNKRAERLEQRQAQSMQQRAINQKNKFKKMGMWIGALALVSIGVFFLFGSTPTTDLAPLSLYSISENDHVKGNPNASFVIIEYSDFQCPACAYYETQVNTLLEAHGDSIAFVYRHFPLKQIHRNAAEAARASEAAARQGKFWEMHDILFENQAEWSGLGNPRSLFGEYALEIGLNQEQFLADIKDPQIAAVVEHHYRSAIQNNFRGTPTFVVNGQQTTFDAIAAQFQ